MAQATREVISKSTKRKRIASTGTFAFTEQVVYKTKQGTRTDGKPRIHSETRHEPDFARRS